MIALVALVRTATSLRLFLICKYQRHCAGTEAAVPGLGAGHECVVGFVMGNSGTGVRYCGAATFLD